MNKADVLRVKSNSVVNDLVEKYAISDEIIYENIIEINKFLNDDQNIDYEKILDFDQANNLFYFAYLKKAESESALNMTFDSAISYQELVEVYNTSEREKLFVEIKNSLMKKKGVYLYGSPGNGKTTIFRHYAKFLFEKGMNVLFLSYSSLVSELKASIENKSLNRKINQLKNVEVLMIDDFSKLGFNSEWLRVEILFQILDHRMENQLLTFINSNFSINDLYPMKNDEKYIEILRLIERIRVLCHEFHFVENSRRNY